MDAGERLVRETVALEAVRYDSQTGLVPVVVQDAHDDQVLMVAYANREALKRTLDTGYAWFWSRSRQEFWQKGATSGNVQRVQEVWLDCDADTVLYRVETAGPACHTGAPSCFYRRILRHLPKDSTEPSDAPLAASGCTLASGWTVAPGATSASDLISTFDPPSTSGSTSTSGPQVASSPTSQVEVQAGAGGVVTEPRTAPPDWSVLTRLWQTMEERWRERPNGSYTSYLFNQGIDKVAKKFGEEGVEVVLAAKNAVGNTGGRGTSPAAGTNGVDVSVDDTPLSAGQAELAAESADALYHLFALWKAAGIHPDDVLQVLAKRAR
ncbi:MAG: phosphoribosyl-AMP cyclohydrolase [Alicyclobacillus herbarius]|uniref:phosphoribosyl-AMP cyclohydrolase n=1 Tax=Alicyclobacillus herbarius TaxID=122960 RepID=UPI002355A261|nr:phosphoribosyl-AMP cyclohydrolase [Alicyclobacillus herbarius]MCL6633383.1 phosphoribosyl-AMP cyclohydrolase [Alicyclobacillus herbarius]